MIPAPSQVHDEPNQEDLPTPPSPLSGQETGSTETKRELPSISEEQDEIESENFVEPGVPASEICDPETVSINIAEERSTIETEDAVADTDLNERTEFPATVSGEIQTVAVPSSPHVIDFRLNKIRIELQKEFPDPKFDGHNVDTLELPLFINLLRKKLAWDKEMYPTSQDQMAYALGQLHVEERSYFAGYINDDGSIRLDSLEDFITILFEKHNKSEKAIESLKSTIALLQSKLKEKKPESKRQEIQSGLQVDNWPAFKRTVEGRPPTAIQALAGSLKFYWQELTDEKQQFTVDSEVQVPLEIWEEKWRNGREIPERIRINSLDLLRALYDVSKGDWAVPQVELVNPSVVFLRPYKFFWHYRENIDKKRDELEEMIHKLKKSYTAAEIDDSQSLETGAVTQEGGTQEELYQTRKLLEDVKCLIRFIETAVTPVARKYRENENVAQTISFADLWYLFRPGDVAVSRGSSEDDAPVSSREGDRTASQNNSSEPTAWRILDITNGRPRLSPRFSNDKYMETGNIFNRLVIQCYKIDYDGSGMGPIINYFYITHFEGEREISSLRLVPLRWAKDQEKLRHRFENIGHKFLSTTKPAFCHQTYVGKKYTHCSNTAECLPAIEGLDSTPKHIQGSVIVDFATAYKENGRWVSYQGLQDPLAADSTEFTETWPLKVWSAKKEEHEYSRSTGEDKAAREYSHCTFCDENIYNDSHVDRSLRLKLVSDDPFLSEFQRRSDDERITVEEFEKKFFTENKLILADKVCAYILDRMCFALLAVEGLQDPIQDSQGWNDLLLEPTHQTVIKALVRNHRTKHEQGAAQRSSPIHDLVAGKGEGLVILLHGAPGLGKTSTVECLRDELRVPMLSLSCGNLGFDALEIEKNLEMLFYRAQLWNCIILLDEVDVVLVERGRDQFKENEVCSAFLRKLEYYQGVLFLTTNRVGHIDEAIKSRIHLAIHYPNLSEDIMEELIRNTLQRLKSSPEYKSRLDVNIRDIVRQCMEFIREKMNLKSVNGRVLRNISQVALALAEEEVPDESTLRSLPLRWRHFKQALEFNANFESYLQTTRGNDSKRAFELTVRSDEWSIVEKEKKENEQK